MAAASSRPPSKPYDVDFTIVSAKHLKNVNWRHGDLKPYVIFWVDPDRRLATKSDDHGSTKPVWNERFVLPLAVPPQESLLTLEIFHSKPSETPKPLVGTLRLPLKDVMCLEDSTKVRSFELRLPSGRPQGKIRLKISIQERPSPPDFQIPPPSSYYFSTAPPQPASRDYRGYNIPPYNPHQPPSPAAMPPPPHPTLSPPLPTLSSPPPPHSHPYHYGGYSDPYSSYYPGYYTQPPYPPRPFLDRQPSFGRPGPSAPVDYAPYDNKRSGKMGLGTGLAVGAVAGALGGLALEEGLKYEEEKIAERVECDISGRDNYSDYHVDY
ncbi:wiskott-Aldrich syndrome protein family member 2-like [Ipomoea triloba]|uniref:wiskott-Aldrich syndrome protein family member 2-like n=1 Tax=Ipomoea triloba TaxID=35885 RepID=UPI00125CEF81|nr:wiskott-Aldrich syndrome protein family member 2-like [Ipomoea triloba]